MIHPDIPLLKDLSVPGRIGASLPRLDVEETPIPPQLLRDSLTLPEMDELSVVRHFTLLSQRNYSIDGQFYPLGSCTMKYNPKMNEAAASLTGFRRTHPLSPERISRGAIDLLYKLQRSLEAITGFSAVSLQPAAGAQGELTGVFMIRDYHRRRGENRRTRILIPDSAHGTNPASCTMAGLIAQTIPSNTSGGVDLDALRAACAEEGGKTLAGLMITNPSTLGLFECNIEEIVRIVHEAGGLVYGDGANMNALVGVLRPADLGFDVMHFNLHKTFSTPHGGGGPGAGAVGAAPSLSDYLPGPLAAMSSEGPTFTVPKHSIGRMKVFNGNFGVLVRAYAYILMLGADGLRRVAEGAVLNANYLRALVEHAYPVAYGEGRRSMHEFVSTGIPNVHTLDVAKRLIDYGFHPPTIYFPLIVKEALMIEPTETESKETLDAFAKALLSIAEEARSNPELLLAAPHDTPVGRLDETAAARKPILCYR
ncbi:MAG: aminomethyl-transferring glycine dehydrogenase subunit GcvPB [Treponemataceae bacterium]